MGRLRWIRPTIAIVAASAAVIGAVVAGPTPIAEGAAGVFDYDKNKPLEATTSKAEATDVALVKKYLGIPTA